MKSYTDIEQSKKLAEILPIESADMCYKAYREEGGILDYQVTLCPYKFASCVGVPCWSLAALIEALPLGVDIHNITDGHKMYYYMEIYTKEIYMKLRRMGKEEICLSTERRENLVDACCEMITKSHEQKIL